VISWFQAFAFICNLYRYIKVASRLSKRSLVTAFTQWSSGVKEAAAEEQRREAIMARVVVRFAKRGMTSAFNTWASNVAARDKFRAKAAAVMRRMKNLQLHAALGRWRELTSEEDRQRRVLLRWGCTS
jgi:hypothetical protein